jgi:prepilin-type processing-associated H-X9-DG protein
MFEVKARRSKKTSAALVGFAKPQPTLPGLHPHRTPRRHRDHRDPGGDAVAGTFQSEGQGPRHRLSEQLQLGWHMYVDDHADVMPPSAGRGAQNIGCWVLGDVRVSAALTNLETGVLFPYVRSTGLYRCPADRSTVQGVPKRLRPRSYSINGQLNALEGYGEDVPYFVAQKVTGIPLPGPSQLIVFIDEGERSIGWGDFGWANKDTPTWVSMPADRHNQSGSLSFGDGHVAPVRWKSPKYNRAGSSQPLDSNGIDPRHVVLHRQ